MKPKYRLKKEDNTGEQYSLICLDCGKTEIKRAVKGLPAPNIPTSEVYGCICARFNCAMGFHNFTNTERVEQTTNGKDLR